MAIEWHNPVDRHGVTKDTYEGRVLSTHCDRNVRIMSDVWADRHYAEVWTGTKVQSVLTGVSGHSHDARTVTVDATPETLAAVEAWREAEAFIRAARPTFIVFESGVDGLEGDPMSHQKITPRAIREVTQRVVAIAEEHASGRLLVLGGGGYAQPITSEGWVAVVEGLAGV